MQLVELKNVVSGHAGEFHCDKLGDESSTKRVPFIHVFNEPNLTPTEFPFEGVRDFYDTFGSLTLFYDKVSEEAAYYIAPPEEWELLELGFRQWLEDLSEEEEEELLPEWIDDCFVFGETPGSGNYLVMPLTGERAGYVFEFDHDGFEFIELAESLEGFVRSALVPSEERLTDMASHMRFVENDNHSEQWWISEMQDNSGNRVKTNG